MHSVSGMSGDRASGVTRTNPRNGRQCRRCTKFGTFTPLSLVCDRCLGALPLIFDIAVIVIVFGGGR
jgi:hypothetical protein